MLPSSQRLSVEQFNSVMEKGRVSHSSVFLMRSLKDASFGKPKISVVVPQKIAKTAVSRNRYRRKMYEAVQVIYPSLSDGFRAIVFAKSTILDLEFAVIAKEMKEIFVKSGLLK